MNKSSEHDAVWKVEQALDRQEGSAHQSNSNLNMELEELEMIQGQLVAATAYCDKLQPESSLIGE